MMGFVGKLHRGALSVGLALALWLPASAAEGPTAVVERVNTTLLGVMREAEGLGFDGRYDRIEKVFGESFDFPFMARVAAGRYWQDMPAKEQERYVAAFEHMSIATYAARFDGYSGQDFQVGEAVDHPRGSVLVRNLLVRPRDEPVAIDYLLRDFDGDWRIVDIYLAGGISEIATKRSEYGSVLKRQGIEALLSSIEQKAAALATDEGQ
jgi:phospholipid transport system substrate-binding protein